jgi:hypothetical protein
MQFDGFETLEAEFSPVSPLRPRITSFGLPINPMHLEENAYQN